MATHIHTPPPPAIKSMSLDLQTEASTASCQISADLCPASQLQEKLHWPPKKRAPLAKILSFDATQKQEMRRGLAREWKAGRVAKQKMEQALAIQNQKDNNLIYLYNKPVHLLDEKEKAERSTLDLKTKNNYRACFEKCKRSKTQINDMQKKMKLDLKKKLGAYRAYDAIEAIITQQAALHN